MNALKYPIPDFLRNILTPKEYSGWIVDKAYDVRHRDELRKSPWLPYTGYGNLIHEAVVAGKGIDPYSRESLRFDLIHTWNPVKARGDIEFQKQFYEMPAVDHIDPEGKELALEICSYQINACKSQQNPMEFLDMCRRIVEYAAKGLCPASTPTPSPFYGEGEKNVPHPGLWPSLSGPSATSKGRHRRGKRQVQCQECVRGEINATRRELKNPPKYFPPDYLNGIITPEFYRKWLHHKAHVIYHEDKKLKRLWALNGSEALYEMKIHEAVQHGMTDPFTGDTLQWELIGTWTNKKDPNTIEKRYRLMPTVDHIDPGALELEFEICSWLINSCKWNMNPQEFIALCEKVQKTCGTPRTIV